MSWRHQGIVAWIRFFASEYQHYGFRVAWHNFRFELGYKIGGFTSAYKSK